MREIINPITEEYLAFKKLISSVDFAWYWNSNTVEDASGKYSQGEIPFFNHTIIRRPMEAPEFVVYPKPNSQYVDISSVIIHQILRKNDIPLNCVYRASCNMTLPHLSKELHVKPHVDHDTIYHRNLLVYLNEVDGDTVLCDNEDNVISSESPKEDKVIIFEGRHYHYLPTTSRRLVFVCTFI